MCDAEVCSEQAGVVNIASCHHSSTDERRHSRPRTSYDATSYCEPEPESNGRQLPPVPCNCLSRVTSVSETSGVNLGDQHSDSGIHEFNSASPSLYWWLISSTREPAPVLGEYAELPKHHYHNSGPAGDAPTSDVISGEPQIDDEISTNGNIPSSEVVTMV